MLGWILGYVANWVDRSRLPAHRGDMTVYRNLDGTTGDKNRSDISNDNNRNNDDGSEDKTTPDSLITIEREGTITIKRDRFGVPHIYGDSIADVVFGQGFAMAQDRLWQLETVRRVSHGRLSEIVGPEALEIDQLMRTLRFTHCGRRDMAEIADEAERRYIRSFVCGINAYIQSRYYRRPVEFVLLGITAEPWTLVDCAAILRLLSFQLNRGFQVKITNIALRDALSKCIGSPAATTDGDGDDRRDILEGLRFAFNDSLPPWREGSDRTTTTVLPKGVIEANEVDWDRLKSTVDMLPPQDQGSNAYAISGKHTTTGKPILASDPHLAVSNPNVWYENHLVCRNEGLDCMGVTMVGSYGVSIGSSTFCSWGITLAFADMFDVYVEEVKRVDRTVGDGEGGEEWSCRFQDEWVPLETIRETIKIKGKPDHTHVIRIVPHHGPIISGLVQSIATKKQTEHTGKDVEQVQKEFSLRASYMEPLQRYKGKNVMDAFIGMNMAKSWSEWRESVRRLEPTSLSVVYADVDGNIAYQCSGNVPNRQHFVEKLKGRELHNLPLDGTSGEYEWNGHIPWEEMPYSLNPERGYIVSCNNKLVDEQSYKYADSFGNLYVSSYRAERISMLIDGYIAGGRKMSVQEARDIQKDVLDLSAKELMDVIREELMKIDENHELFKQRSDVSYEMIDKVRETLLSWDHCFDVNSSGATIFTVLKEHMLRNVMNTSFDGVGDTLMGMALGAGSPQPVIVDTEYLQNQSAILLHMINLSRDMPTEKTFIGRAGGLPMLLVRSLMDAVIRIRSILGLANSARTYWLSFGRRRRLSPEKEIEIHWRWGNIHKIVWKHAFSDKIPAFTREGELQGGSNTVSLAEYLPSSGNFNANTVPSMRMVIDLANIKHNSKIVIHPGNSGHLASPHYDDMIEPFLNGLYHPMYFSDSDIDQHCEGTLVLQTKITSN